MRCYNGAWDSEAQALFKEHDRLMTEIRKIEPEAHCTYHPTLDCFVIHVWGRELGPYRRTKLDALRATLALLTT